MPLIYTPQNNIIVGIQHNYYYFFFLLICISWVFYYLEKYITPVAEKKKSQNRDQEKILF